MSEEAREDLYKMLDEAHRQSKIDPTSKPDWSAYPKVEDLLDDPPTLARMTREWMRDRGVTVHH